MTTPSPWAPPDMPWVYERPAEIVEAQIAAMTERADTWSAELFDIMQRMTEIGRWFPGDTQPPQINVPDLQLPARANPAAPDVSLLGEITPFDAPAFQSLAFDEGVVWGTPPVFTPTITSFAIPAPPAPINPGAMPERPLINQITLPASPALPGVEPPALLTIDIPQVVMPVMPAFDPGQDPVFEGQLPTSAIAYTEPAYASDVLDATRAQVLRMLAGGTGLHPAIEQALFERARGREDQQAQKGIDEAHATFAARGYEIPPGAMVATIDAIRERNQLTAADLSRDILARSAQWEIENLRAAVSDGIALETVLIQLHNSVAARALDLARARIDAEVAVGNLFVQMYNARVQARTARAQIFDVQLRAALATLEAQKLQIEAESLKGQVNEQLVRTYAARLEAVRNIVEIYRSQVAGAQAQAEIERSKIEIYRADVQAFAEQLRAREVEFTAYGERVRAEAAKAGMLDAEARAFAATVDAFGTVENTKIARIQARREALLASVQKFEADVRAEAERVRGDLGQIQARGESFRADLARYSAELGADTSERGMRLQLVEARIRNVLAATQMVTDQYNNAIARQLQQAQIMTQTLTAQGGFAAQLAAGAMSAQHVQASLSGNGSASAASSSSYSRSDNYNYQG